MRLSVELDLDTSKAMGVDIDKVITRTFILGGLLGGAAGFLFGIQFGVQYNMHSARFLASLRD